MVNHSHSPLCDKCSHINKIFCGLNIGKHNTIFEENKSVNYKKGMSIFSEGKYPTGIHIIHSGKVKIVKIGDEGKEQIVRFAKTGELLGYRALFGNHAYKASAIALNEVQICHISEKKFFNILSKNQYLYLNLLKKLSLDLGRAEDTILSISQKSAKERIAETIVSLYYKFGHDKNNSIDVQLTRKEIGNLAGTTIETTIRTLSNLKKEHLIELNGKQIVVKDMAGLMCTAHYENQ